MRPKLLIASTLVFGLAACGDKQEESGNAIAAEQGFSVENSAANDVTAIDAATADAAGMAADAEAELTLDNLANEAADNRSAGNSADEE